MRRREFFADFVRGVIPFTGPSTAVAESPRRNVHWLRPPGALAESEFLKTCTQCTDCIEACPHQSIRRLGPEFGVHAGTPAIIPSESPCYLCEDMPCISSCETGVLQPTSREKVRMGSVRLDRNACYAAQGQPCDYCVTRCPLSGTAIEWASDALPVIHDHNCAGCAVCVHLCPADALSICSTG